MEGGWAGGPELALWVGHSGDVSLSPDPYGSMWILGSVWITTTCSRDWDLLPLAEVLWVGFLVFYLIETLSHPPSSQVTGEQLSQPGGAQKSQEKLPLGTCASSLAPRWPISNVWKVARAQGNVLAAEHGSVKAEK